MYIYGRGRGLQVADPREALCERRLRPPGFIGTSTTKENNEHSEEKDQSEQENDKTTNKRTINLSRKMIDLNLTPERSALLKLSPPFW
jgi:hypothetical protein